MTFWAVVIITSFVSAGFLIAPVVRREKRVPETGPDALGERLAAIDRDRAAGLIGESEAAEALAEAELGAHATDASEKRVAPRTRLASVAFAGLAPLIAIFVYLAIGSPQLTGFNAKTAAVDPAAEIAALPDEERQAMIQSMVAGLAARLKENPEDAEGWRMLARSHSVLGESAKSAGAWRELLNRVEGTPDDWRDYAGVLIALGPDPAREAELKGAIGWLHAYDPDDPMALYYLGEQASAAGDRATAVKHWTRLLEVLPADALVRPAIEALLREDGPGSGG